MNNDYCILYNERFGLAAEAISLKNICYVNPSTAPAYFVFRASFGQFELKIALKKIYRQERGKCTKKLQS